MTTMPTMMMMLMVMTIIVFTITIMEIRKMQSPYETGQKDPRELQYFDLIKLEYCL